MRKTPANFDYVEVDGLPPGCIFCEPITAIALKRLAKDGTSIEIEAPHHRPPWISDVSATLKRLVSQHRR